MALQFNCTAPKKEGNRSGESLSLGSGVRDDSCGGWIGKQNFFFNLAFFFFYKNKLMHVITET